MTKGLRILQHLSGGRTITSVEAFRLYNITRLSAIVHRLKRSGYNIIAEPVEETGNHFARYRMGSGKVAIRQPVFSGGLVPTSAAMISGMGLALRRLGRWMEEHRLGRDYIVDERVLGMPFAIDANNVWLLGKLLSELARGDCDATLSRKVAQFARTGGLANLGVLNILNLALQVNGAVRLKKKAKGE